MGKEISSAQNLQMVSEKMLLDFLKQSNSNLTEHEMGMFCSVAMAENLNPYKREIYAVAYGSGDRRKLSIITGYEVYLKRAQATGLLDGFSVQINGKFKSGKITKRKNDGNTYQIDARLPDGDVSATCTIWIKNRVHPFEWTVAFDEYTQHNEMWYSKPETMIKKVCIEQAFRLAFAGEMGGLPYAREELPDAMTAPDVQNAEVVDPKEQPILTYNTQTNARTAEQPQQQPTASSAQTNAPPAPVQPAQPKQPSGFVSEISQILSGIPKAIADNIGGNVVAGFGQKKCADIPQKDRQAFLAALQLQASAWRQEYAQNNETDDIPEF